MKLKASFTLLVVFVLALTATAQNITEFDIHRLEKIKRVAQPDFKKTTKKKGHLTRDDWQKLIDERWGQGLPTDQKLQIFDSFWNRIDRSYAGFPNSDVDWNALREKYRPEVEAGVSRGRFDAIINHMCLALHEIHTEAYDDGIFNDVLEPGVPLMVGFSTYLHNNHFGAALTPLPDSSLLVYKVVENHPLGLELGDRVLGYDGQPWKSLYKELLSFELPITLLGFGTTIESDSHTWLTTAGENWHLFDTIDIIKYVSSDTLHMSTSLLVGHNWDFRGSEQMPVPGVPFPDIDNKRGISWGVINNTNVGYIYTYAWTTELNSQQFQTAILDFMNNHNTEGLIIDTRLDFGGQPYLATAGLRHLFNFDVYKLVTDKRTDPNNHFGFTQAAPAFVCSYENDGFVATNDIYDKPIAVLTGPASLSVGDGFPFIASLQPYARTFGKPTNGAFSCYDDPASVPLTAGWSMIYANYNSYSVDDPHKYLTHSAPGIDEEVWLGQDDVANGEDTVVKRAIKWIQNKVYPHDAVSKTYNVSERFQAKVHLHNPNNHAVVLWSYLNNADHSVVLDSAQLALSDSNLYSGSLEIPPIEGDFSLTYKSVDLDDGAIQVLPFVDRFTTRGPVSVDHYEVTSADTVPNPGDLLEVKLYMKNGGRRASIQNIKIALLAIDPCVGPWRLNLRTLDSLRAEEVKDHSGAFMILFDSGCEAPAVHPLQVNIYENDKLHWIDTLYIELKPDITGIADRHATPNVFDLQQNYPNPFNPATKIEFALAKREKVKLEVFDLLGTQVATLVDETLEAGAHSAAFEANNLPTGLYFYRIQAGEFVQTKKLTILR